MLNSLTAPFTVVDMWSLLIGFVAITFFGVFAISPASARHKLGSFRDGINSIRHGAFGSTSRQVICMADGSHFAGERLMAFTPWHPDAESGSHPPHPISGVELTILRQTETSAFDPTADVRCFAASSVWTAVRAIANCGWNGYAALTF
jgi:hypothetical protein